MHVLRRRRCCPQVHSYDDPAACINSVAFHPDGTCVATGGTDNSIKVWDLRSNALVQHYKAHTGEWST